MGCPWKCWRTALTVRTRHWWQPFTYSNLASHHVGIECVARKISTIIWLFLFLSHHCPVFWDHSEWIKMMNFILLQGLVNNWWDRLDDGAWWPAQKANPPRWLLWCARSLLNCCAAGQEYKAIFWSIIFGYNTRSVYTISHIIKRNSGVFYCFVNHRVRLWLRENNNCHHPTTPRLM